MIFLNKKIKNHLYIFFIILFILLSKFSTNHSNANTYKVENIEVEKPYDLNFNKNEVIEKAFSVAFKNLIYKITLSRDKDNLRTIEIDKIKKIIDSFSIVDENFVNNKYSAKFEVTFEKKGVLKFLESKNIFSSIPIEKKVFILPILIDLEKNQTFSLSENYFYQNWNKNKQMYHLLEYIAPNEDLEDIKLIQKRLDSIEDYEFKEIAAKYNLKDFIMTIFFKDKDKINVLSKVFLNNKLSILNNSFEKTDLLDSKINDQIITDLKTIYEDEWKKLNLINTSIKLSVTLSINSKNVNLIKKFEEKLSSLDLVSNYMIDNFSSNSTVYKIIYNSTPDKFLLEFNESGFKIDTSQKIWTIK